MPSFATNRLKMPAFPRDTTVQSARFYSGAELSVESPLQNGLFEFL